MKKATKQMIELFPMLEGNLHAHDNLVRREEVIKSLSSVESTFLKLAWFFEHPEQESFDLSTFYKELDDQWLEYGLALITTYFREDTYLIKKHSFSLIREGDQYFNQIQFADYLKEEGLNYNRSKLNVYYKRGKVPKADLELSGTPYWSKMTVAKFGEQEKKRMRLISY
jgi:hypothetical protein